MWLVVQVVALVCVLSHQVCSAAEGHCIWYGQCGIGDMQQQVNCYYNGTAKSVLNDTENGAEMMGLLKSFCPNLYTGDDTMTCCDYAQLRTLVKSMSYPEPMYDRCPSCWADYRDLFCALTCDPHMSNFIAAEKTSEPLSHCSKENKCKVLQVGYYLTNEYANTLFNACNHVQFPSSNQRVIGSFCDGRTAAQCTAKIFLDYQGSTSNGFAPFDIDFKIVDKDPNYQPYNRTLYRCDQPLKSSHCGFACSCSDCPAACTSSLHIPKASSPFKIGGIEGIAMIMIIVYSAFLAVFFVCVLIGLQYYRKGDTVEVRKTSPGLASRQERFYRSIEKHPQPGTQSNPYSSVQDDLRHLMAHDDLLDHGHGVEASGSSSINGDYGVEEQQQHEDEETEIIKKAGCVTRMGLKLEYSLIRFFRWWGTFCATYPLSVIFICLGIVAVLACGMTQLTVTTNPVKLWSAPNSRSRLEKDYFDSHFGPFYRTEQVIIRAPKVSQYNYTDTSGLGRVVTLFGSVFNKTVLKEVYWLQKNIMNLTTADGTTLKDICWQPLYPDNDHCAVESVWQYFQNNLSSLDMKIADDFGNLEADYHTHLMYCFNDPTSVNDTKMHHSCLADYGGLVPPNVALGGYNDSSLSPPYVLADTLFLTIIVNNHLDESKNKKAEAWEKEYIQYLKNYTKNKNRLIDISFSSERSIPDEINRESSSDILTVVISYVLMFVYVAIFLGHLHSLQRLFLDTKICLGLAGVMIVLSAVLSSIGLFSYCGQPVTLVVVEVIPFLVLAVGVDNIFILVQAFQRRNLPDTMTLADQVGTVLGQIAPSMLLTGISESIAFFLGALTTAPAVRAFSLYAGMAIFIDFLLQVTCFVALLFLDAKRQRNKRLDVLCCIHDKKAPSAREGARGLLYSFIRDYYSYFLMNNVVRAVVMAIFVGGFAASVVGMNHLHVGLNQEVSMPKDSYLQDYFKDQADYGRTGPPVYFVVKDGIDYSDPEEQNRICSLPGCNSDSLTAQLSAQATIKHYSKIASAPNSWLDDYLTWASPSINCCRIYEKSGDFCNSAVSMDSTDCEKCLNQSDLLTCFSPKPKKFYHFLHYFLKDNPSKNCSKGGHAAYAKALDFRSNNSITSSYFSTYHTALAVDTDFIDALKRAREISDNLTKTLNGSAEVFPYSLVYVYYEQYLTIVHEAAMNLGLCAAAIFVVTFLLMGFSLSCAIIVTMNVAMIVVDVMGVMYLWNISFNAVSVVNLVMAVGISVEFCSHTTRSFAISREPNRIARARHALTEMGSSVLSGITLTKFVGIVVLAFSKSQLFEIFYFRMYLSIVLLGAGHGLIFLPVLLSYLGPAAMPSAEVLMKPERVKGISRSSDIQRSSRHSSAVHRAPSQSPVLAQVSPAVYAGQVYPHTAPPTEKSRLLGNASQ